MVTRAQVCAEALEWLGTPYRFQASLKGVGADCIGLLTGVARQLGIIPADFQTPWYDPEFHVHHDRELYAELLAAHGCTPIALPLAEPADILLFQFRPYRVASHGAFLIDAERVVHAAFRRQVVCHRLDATWTRRLAWVFRLPEVTP